MRNEARKRWSKLKRDMEQLFLPELSLKIHCNSYKIGSHGNAVPRFYFVLNKTIIWDFPKSYFTGFESFHGWAWEMDFSQTMRNYINCPLQDIFDIKLDGSYQYGEQSLTEGVTDMIQILLSADRRLGKERLVEWFKNNPNQFAEIVMASRFQKNPQT